MNQIIHGDNLQVLPTLQDNSYSLIYIDPPFNTGKVQKRNSYKYSDKYDNFTDFLIPRVEAALPKLTSNGSLFVHLDYREVHYVKVELDKLLGRQCFMNEIIWSYDFGARQKNKWPTKHDTILWYVKNPDDYIFNYDNIDRIPYITKSVGLVSKEKQEKGKTLTDVWWNTIVPTNSKEKVGYPTQKPLKIVERIVKVHSNVGDQCLDFFAGSGTLGAACKKNDRFYTLIDQNEDAINVIKERLK